MHARPRNLFNSGLGSQKGQTSIFMALFISTMIMLFAFTTNIGMLVHAKINLQNAADAAAYAGAAVQARHLTAVGYLNWEMRRAVKEFLFYTAVRSQYTALPCFPLDAQGNRLGGFCPAENPEAQFSFAFYDPREGNSETGGPYIPTTCIIFDPDNNYCQKAHVPGIPEFPSGGGWGVADPVVTAVIQATNQIIDRKVNDCKGRTDINRQFLVDWLFNVYPHADEFSRRYIGNDSDDPFDHNTGLDRLGVLPKIAILRARMDNFEEMLNVNLANEGVGGATISEATVGGLKGATGGNKTLDYFERSIQAYLSAKNNLPSVEKENGIFSDLELTELIPNQAGTGDTNPDLKNPPILARFKDIVSKVDFANSKFEEIAGALRGNCKQFRELRTVAAFPYGVTKDPNVITYYAIRLQAKARLLFSPFGSDGTVTLSAYSAAKPFGSRIGKDLSLRPEDMMKTPGQLSQDDSTVDTLIGKSHPNVLVRDNDVSTKTQGFFVNAHLGYLRGAMYQFNDRNAGKRLAGAYAPWEVGYYTPPANFQAPESIGLFPDNPSYGEGGTGKYFKMTAPVAPVNGAAGGSLSFIRTRVLRYLSGDLASGDTLDGRFAAYKEGALSDNMFSMLFDYMTQYQLVDAHLISDPLLNDDTGLQNYAKSYGQNFSVIAMTSPQKRQLTSWNNQKTAQDTSDGIPANSELGLDYGRSGYSVRFISFPVLRTGGRATNDPEITTEWTSPFSRLDAGGANNARLEDDISKISH